MRWYVEDVNNNTRKSVTVGDYVCFKGDMETSGQIIGQKGAFMVVAVKDDWGDTTSHHVRPQEAWVEE